MDLRHKEACMCCLFTGIKVAVGLGSSWSPASLISVRTEVKPTKKKKPVGGRLAISRSERISLPFLSSPRKRAGAGLIQEGGDSGTPTVCYSISGEDGGVYVGRSRVSNVPKSGKTEDGVPPIELPHSPLDTPPRLQHGHMRGSGCSACWICCGCSGGGSCSGSSASTMLWQCGGGVPSLLELSATSPLWRK